MTFFQASDLWLFGSVLFFFLISALMMDIQLSYAHLSVPGSPLLGDFLKAFTLSKSYEVDRLLISMLTIKKNRMEILRVIHKILFSFYS